MKLTGQVRSERHPPAVTPSPPPPPAQGAWQRFLAWYLGWFASIFKPRR